MTTTPAFHRLHDALKAGDVLDDDTQAALNHLQAAEDAMISIGTLIASCTDRPSEVLDYIANTFPNYGWGERPERGERYKGGAGPAERWLSEVTDDQPLIWASTSTVAVAREIDHMFHPCEDEED